MYRVRFLDGLDPTPFSPPPLFFFKLTTDLPLEFVDAAGGGGVVVVTAGGGASAAAAAAEDDGGGGGG